MRSIVTLTCLAVVCTSAAAAQARPRPPDFAQPPSGSHATIVGAPAIEREPDRDRPPGPEVMDLAIGVSAGLVQGGGQLGDATTTISFFENVRAVIGREVGWATGADLMLGTTGDGGFGYELNAYLLGVGIRSEHGAVSLIAGGGIGGITGEHIGFGWQLPVELNAAVPLSDEVRLRSYARAQWVIGDDARQNGSSAAPFGDELRAGVGVQVGNDPGTGDHLWGHWVGVSYSELMGVEMITIELGGALSHSLW